MIKQRHPISRNRREVNSDFERLRGEAKGRNIVNTLPRPELQSPVEKVPSGIGGTGVNPDWGQESGLGNGD